MKTPLLLTAAVLALGLNAAYAADDAAKDAAKDLTAPPAGDGKGKRCMHDMMMDGPHGMMGMRDHGPMMMGGHMGEMIMVPRLPAGNDKLQLQMHAEIMQKIGEIEAKYAAQIK